MSREKKIETVYKHARVSAQEAAFLTPGDELVCRVHGDLLDWGTSEAGGNRRWCETLGD